MNKAKVSRKGLFFLGVIAVVGVVKLIITGQFL